MSVLRLPVAQTAAVRQFAEQHEIGLGFQPLGADEVSIEGADDDVALVHIKFGGIWIDPPRSRDMVQIANLHATKTGGVR